MSGDPFAVLGGVARQLGDAAAAADLDVLRDRIAQRRFFVACVGQFKRGKSTLLNALVGAAVLPVGVIPVTAVVTVLRHGPEPRARVKTRAGWRDLGVDDLASYVTEEKNPGNEKGVVAAEVYLPSDLLASGMCLVDTPGIGSVFATNTAATHDFLPHVDAALVVLGADPPISGEELSLLSDVGARVDDVRIVINKADRLDADDLEQARVFTLNVVRERLGRPVGDVLVVSAAERTVGSKSRDWRALEACLESWAHEASGDIVESARRRGLARIRARLRASVDAHRAALLLPLEESSRRLDALARAVEGAERALADIVPLFRTEEAALDRSLEKQRERFLEGVRESATSELSARLDVEDVSRRLGPRAMELAQEIARNRIDEWARRARPEADVLYRRAVARFVTLGNDFLRRVRETGGEELADLPAELDAEHEALDARSQFYFTELLAVAPPAPVSAVVAALFSPAQARRAACKRAAPYLLRLIETNSARMMNDLKQRTRESGARLRHEIAERLRATVATAERARERAQHVRDDGEPAVAAESRRLDALRLRLEEDTYR